MTGLIKSKIIPNTNKRYTITEDGVIFSNYRYNKKGERVLCIREVRKYLNTKNSKTLVVDLQFGKYSLENRSRTVHLNTLMEKCFSLRPPDKYHLYDLRFKDGNCFNSSLKNLEYKIRLNSDSGYKYYPQPFYGRGGKITHKKCALCGEKKEIKHFNLQKPKRQGQNKTYRNSCESCRSKKQWAYITSDINRLERQLHHSKRWAETPDGKRYFKEYRKRRSRYEVDNLTPHYLASCLKMKEKDLTPELISISRKKLLLIRTIKQTTK